MDYFGVVYRWPSRLMCEGLLYPFSKFFLFFSFLQEMEYLQFYSLMVALIDKFDVSQSIWQHPPGDCAQL